MTADLLSPTTVPVSDACARRSMARSRYLLTAISVARVKKPGLYPDGGGLSLIVTDKLTKRWELRLTANGRKRQLGLGIYPAITLDQARREAENIRQRANLGEAALSKREARRKLRDALPAPSAQQIVVAVDSYTEALNCAMAYSGRVVRSKMPEKLARAIIKAHGCTCQYCGDPCANVVEHIVPIAQGGADTLANMTASCMPCNASKGMRFLPKRFAAELALRAQAVAGDIEAMAVSKETVERNVRIDARDEINPPLLPSDLASVDLMLIDDVSSITSLPPNLITGSVKRGTFPAPMTVEGLSAWRKSEVLAWIKERIETGKAA